MSGVIPDDPGADLDDVEERMALADALGVESGEVLDALAAAREVVALFAGDRFTADFPGRRDRALAGLRSALDEVDEAARR